nr:MAG TPA: hypothetical protein [Caudoviricetes sp.]
MCIIHNMLLFSSYTLLVYKLESSHIYYTILCKLR